VRQVSRQTAPALAAHEVELEPRPHTSPANEEPLVEFSKEDILAMSNEQLSHVIWELLGVVIDPTEPRTKLLSKLLETAVEIVEIA
jgi:hypothetical protein